MVRSEGNMSLKIVTPPGIDVGTVRPQRLNHYATPGILCVKYELFIDNADKVVHRPKLSVWSRTPVATRYKDRQTDRPVIVKLLLQALEFSFQIVHKRYTNKRHLFVVLFKFPTVSSNNMVDARYSVIGVTVALV